MAYATPKAIDFDAYTLAGVKLSPLSETGLAARWDVADECKEINLLGMTSDKRKALNAACSRVGAKHGLILKYGG